MAGAFEEPIDGVTSFGGFPEGKGPKCPKCESRNTQAIARDMVWEETTVQCQNCNKVFID